MKKLFKDPHLIFLLSIPVLLLAGISSQKKMSTIQVLDTFYVFEQSFLIFFISILFGIIGLGYWLMIKANKKLSKRLNKIHIILTVGGILLIWLLAQLFQLQYGFEFKNYLTLMIYFLTTITVLGQVIYLVNLGKGFLQKKN